jgi:hypothetical protein
VSDGRFDVGVPSCHAGAPAFGVGVLPSVGVLNDNADPPPRSEPGLHWCVTSAYQQQVGNVSNRLEMPTTSNSILAGGRLSVVTGSSTHTPLTMLLQEHKILWR